MTTARSLRTASNDTLRAHIVNGYPVDPAAIEGWTYRGTSLGLPRVAEKLTWKTFQKTFWRDPLSGRLLGWNVRLEQDGIDAPSRPKLIRGRPFTTWYYEVVSPAGVRAPRGFDRGLIIDYSRAPNPPGPVRITKDPLVSLSPDNADELIGVSYLVIAGRCLETPTYFTLERECRIEYVPPEFAGSTSAQSGNPIDLTSIERRWAEDLFAAVLGTGGADGLPAFGSVDTSTFWRCFETAPPPLVRAGLRPMVHTLTFLPIVSGYGRPFFALDPTERERFLASVARDPRYFVRQSFTTLKTLACFAWFEDPRVRSRFDASARPGSVA